MKRVKRTARTLVLAIMLCMIFAIAATAAETGSLWISADESSTGTTAAIVTDTTVTDGLVEIRYDSSALTFLDVDVNDDYVALFAVNSDTEGLVKISWVATEAYEADGTGILLMELNFSGTLKDSALTLTGSACAPDGSSVAITEGVDITELEKAILEAEALKKDLYTAESFAAVKEALEQAQETLDNPAASQSEVDAAVKALRDAMDALELKQSDSDSAADTTELEKAIAKAEGLNKKNYTQKSYAVVEKALKAAKNVLADKDATQAEVDAAAKALNDAIAALVLANTATPGTGDDNSMTIFVALAALAVVGIVAVLILMNSKKGRYGK